MTLIEHNMDGEVPHRIAGLLPRDEDVAHDVEALPSNVAEYFSNAKKALAVGLADSAGVELRKTLEAATAASGVDGKVLVQRVKQLIDQGQVTKAFEPALGYIRKIGNVGAHAGDEKLSQGEVAQALTFTTLLLKTLFELPSQVQALEAQAPPPPVDA